MSPIMRPSEIWSGPSTSKAGIRYVVRAILITFATANSTSDTISGSSGFHSNRAEKYTVKYSAVSEQVWHSHRAKNTWQNIVVSLRRCDTRTVLKNKQ